MAVHPLGFIVTGLSCVTVAAAGVALVAAPGGDGAGEPAAVEAPVSAADARQMRFEELDKMRLDCATGDGAACYELARDYETRTDYWGQPVAGDGLRRDDKKAVYFFRRACEYGVADGCENLARMYETGKGVAKNRAEAARYKRMACADGAAGCETRAAGAAGAGDAR